MTQLKMTTLIPIYALLLVMVLAGCRSTNTGDPAQDAINKAGNVAVQRAFLETGKALAEVRIAKLDESKRVAATAALAIVSGAAKDAIDAYETGDSINGDALLQVAMIKALGALVTIAAESG